MWKWIAKLFSSLFAKSSKPAPVTPTPDAGSGAGGATNSVPSGGTGDVPSTPSEYATIIAVSSVTASMIYWTGTDVNWPEKDGCCGESHLYVYRNGKRVGGKFDHFRRNSRSRDWKNVHGVEIKDEDGKVIRIKRYGAFDTIGEPVGGETCELQLVSYDGKRKSNPATFAWKA